MEPYQPILDAVAEHNDFVRQVIESKLSPLTPLAPAIWSCWKGRARMPLWQAVALSAGFEPIYRLQSGNFAAASLAAEHGLTIEADRYTETLLLARLRHNAEFCKRLALLADRFGGAEMNESHPVEMADVLAVALEMGWSVPDEFKVLAGGGGTAPSTSASPAACPEAVAVPAGAPETPAQKRERLQARVNYWRGQGMRDWTARVAREEGVTVARIRQILSSAKPKEPVGGRKKPRQAATFCSGLMAPSGRTR